MPLIWMDNCKRLQGNEVANVTMKTNIKHVIHSFEKYEQKMGVFLFSLMSFI